MNKNYVIYGIVTALAFVGVGYGLGVRTNQPNPTSKPAIPAVLTSDDAWCDPLHKIPFIDADHCGGMTSCDRAGFLRLAGEKVDVNNLCPK